MTKIVYVDQPSYLPDHVRKQLQGLGELVVYDDKPSTDEIVARLDGADVAIVEWSALPAELFGQVETLKHVVLVTTGYSKVDQASARAAGVAVSNTPEYSRQSVAEHAVGLLLACAKRFRDADERIRENPNAKYTDHSVGIQLYGETLGVIGVGSIGSWVTKIGLGFGMQVLGYNRSKFSIPDVEQVDLPELLQRSRFIVIALPSSPDVAGLLSKDKLGLLPHGSVLVNISGNRCLDQGALAELLTSGQIYGAGLDSSIEPALADAPNLIRTAGTAWYTQRALDRNLEMVAETVRLGLQGAPRFVVN